MLDRPFDSTPHSATTVVAKPPAADLAPEESHLAPREVPRWRPFSVAQPFIMHINVDRSNAAPKAVASTGSATTQRPTVEDETIDVGASGAQRRAAKRLDNGSLVVDGWHCIANDEGEAIDIIARMRMNSLFAWGGPPKPVATLAWKTV